MTFEYMCRVVVEASIDIEDIGNCAIVAFNDFGEEFVIVVQTRYGTSEILQYGPFVPDIEALPNKVTYTYERMDFNEDKIERIIDKFLNSSGRCITQAREEEIPEALGLMKNLADCLGVIK